MSAARAYEIAPVRDAKSSDLAFIVNTWRNSFTGGRVKGKIGGREWKPAPAVLGCDREHYFGEMNRVIRGYLSRCDTRVLHNPNDPDHIIGYACFSGREFHYAYIKESLRDEIGIGHILRDDSIDAYTFRCPYLDDLLIGYNGCRIEVSVNPKNGHEVRRWVPPDGWRFTPRFSIP